MKRVPRTGGVIYSSNHSSNLDPMCIGCVLPRKVNYLAKKSMFYGPFGWFWRRIDMIELDRNRGAAGMKEVLRRLRRDESVLIFPEGTRSKDGEMKKFRPGLLAVVKRVKSPIQPIGIAGTHEAWPSGQLFPKPGYVHVVFGEPIAPEEFEALEEKEMLELLWNRTKVCFDEARYRVKESYYDRTV